MIRLRFTRTWVLNPAFRKADFDRQQKQTLAGIKREENSPVCSGVARDAGTFVWKRSRVWKSVDRFGHERERWEDDPGRPREIPRLMVQAE